MIQISLAPKIWHVRQPEILRVMSAKYVDEFFSDGSLRLSSMASFRKYPDEERGDSREGETHARHTNAKGSQFIFLNTQPVGDNAYILSFTSNTQTDALRVFGDSAIRIKSTFQFGAAVSAVLPHFIEGIEGPCIYTDQFALDRNIGPTGDALFPNEDGLKIGGPEQSLALAQMQASPDFYFKKRIRYAKQNEYRMVWFISGVAQQFIDIKCPAAISICERVSIIE